MRALMRTGLKMMICAGPAGMSAELAGAPVSWATLVFLVLFVGGGIDVAIAAGHNAVCAWRDLEDAPEGSRTVILGWEIGPGRGGRPTRPYDGAHDSRPGGFFMAGGLAYPRGLACWAPPAQISLSLGSPELSESVRRLSAALAASQGQPEKRLAYRAEGVDFPSDDDGPRYVTTDGRGLRTPPFPLHYRTVPEEQYLVDGVRMSPAVIEYHTDFCHPGCPVCETWRREHGR